MIQANSETLPYQTTFTNGTHAGCSDTTIDKGGSGQGLRPHELLEAALASCMNITIRMHAEQNGITLRTVKTAVQVDRSIPDQTCFRYRVDFGDGVSEADKAKIMAILQSCPVRRTLSAQIHFQHDETL